MSVVVDIILIIMDTAVVIIIGVVVIHITNNTFPGMLRIFVIRFIMTLSLPSMVWAKLG